MKPYSLALFDRVKAGSAALGDVTDLLKPTWRRSIRSIGDYWLGTAEIRMDRGELDDLFMDGLLREIRETTLAEETWRGAIVKMEYTRGESIFVRDVTGMANAIRSIYTRIGDNLLTNGSAESGAWTAYNGATVTQSTVWVTDGTYSCKVVCPDAVVRGAFIQSVVAIVEAVEYSFSVKLHIESGGWRVDARRADNNNSIGTFTTSGETGDVEATFTIPISNAYTGNIYILLANLHTMGAATCYADGATFRAAPIAAETGWYSDAESIEMYGRKEDILLRSGKSNADANSECQSLLLDRAWVNPQPPSSGKTWLKSREDVVKVTVAGYWAMLNWIYTTLTGTKTCSEWVTALSALQNTYVSAGMIEPNSTTFYVDDRAPLKVGDLLREVAEAGATGGAKWTIGVGAGRQLNYEAVPAELTYILRHGRLCSLSGDELEPSLVRPGWMLLEDMPIGSGWVSPSAQHDPRWMYLEEVELLADGSLAFRTEAS